ncbi:MAG TPA: PAS domain-containing protein [Candidatus Methylacidiphilales bacterium]|jgi:PAS domain-containing protein|nr:PAS domain-containing protein [Candidatus Methylacidiphilales bacterium]
MHVSFYSKLTGVVIAGLVVVFVIEPLDPSTVSTPFLLGIILMGLSLRQNPALVVAASLIYSILTAFALIQFHHHIALTMPTGPHPLFWLFQRMGLFLVLCGLAIYLSYYRTNTQRILDHVQKILERLPVPVVISDATGQIIYANESICAEFKRDAASLAGKRYFDFFMSDIQEGKAVRFYIELFEEQSDRIHELVLKPFDSEIKIKARLTCLGSGSNRVLITVFNVAEPHGEDGN